MKRITIAVLVSCLCHMAAYALSVGWQLPVSLDGLTRGTSVVDVTLTFAQPEAKAVIQRAERVEPKSDSSARELGYLRRQASVEEVSDSDLVKQDPQAVSGVEWLDPVSYMHNPPPDYPYWARRRGQQGIVVLELEVSSEGQPLDIKLVESSGFDLLDKAALRAVQSWSFVPAKSSAGAILSRARIPIRFVLN